MRPSARRASCGRRRRDRRDRIADVEHAALARSLGAAGADSTALPTTFVIRCTARTPGCRCGRGSVDRQDLARADAASASSRACSIPGSFTSTVKRAAPVTLARPSARGTDLPITASCRVGRKRRRLAGRNLRARSSPIATPSMPSGIAFAGGCRRRSSSTLRRLRRVERRREHVRQGAAAAEMAADGVASRRRATDSRWPSTRAAQLITSPGVQKPHCTASCATNAACTGCSSSPCARPSMVVTLRPPTSTASSMHEATGHAIEPDGAGRARAAVAADLGSGQPELIAQYVDQRRRRFDRNEALDTVDDQVLSPDRAGADDGNVARPSRRMPGSAAAAMAASPVSTAVAPQPPIPCS